jgi:hypothetical protein
MEHTQISEAVDQAIKAVMDNPDTEQFSKGDIRKLVLAEHPSFDPAQLDRAIHVAFDKLTNRILTACSNTRRMQ